MFSVFLAFVLHFALTLAQSSDNTTRVLFETSTNISNEVILLTEASINISKDDMPPTEASINISKDDMPPTETPTNTSNDAIPLTEAPVHILNEFIPPTEILPNISNEVMRLSEESINVSNDSQPTVMDKHKSLASCVSFTLEPGEYELLPNGTIVVEIYNLTLNESHYVFNNGMVTFCVPFEDDESVNQEYAEGTSHLTFIGLGISMISLLLHLVVFSIVPDLRNLPGWHLAALCLSLFLSYLLIFVISSEEVSKHRDACIATASLAHFFLLASILWMSIMSYDIYMSLLRVTGSLRTSGSQFKWKKFALYCTCAFGISLIFAISGLLSDVLDIVPEPYKPEYYSYEDLCWFNKKIPLLIFFAGPVIGLSCLNLLFFGLSAYTIHFNKMRNSQEGQESILRRRYMMYFRLSVIMGVTWIVGTVAALGDVRWLWYIFVLLNTLQGFFIFLAFTCSKKVKKYFREKLFGGRRGSEQTLSPTFQSYCFYANSIEKDLDKIVEKGKENTDTIVIHL